MKTSIFAVAASLLFAAFAAANPAPIRDLDTTPNTLEPRCESCEEACPKTHFYYAPKKCCLQNGGPKNPPSPPKEKDCPSYWYWNHEKTCCTPRYPQPPNPKPSCGSSTFPWWDKDKGCCSKPPTGTNPPHPGTSYRPKRDVHQPKSKYTARKFEVKNRQVEQCPTGLTMCPIPGTNNDFECISNTDLRTCGGCPAYGVGQDCTTIPSSASVTCEPFGQTAHCIVFSCEDGYLPSSDSTSCVAA